MWQRIETQRRLCGRMTGTVPRVNSLGIGRPGRVALVSNDDAGVQCLLGGVSPGPGFEAAGGMQGPTLRQHLILECLPADITATRVTGRPEQ